MLSLNMSNIKNYKHQILKIEITPVDGCKKFGVNYSDGAHQIISWRKHDHHSFQNTLSQPIALLHLHERKLYTHCKKCKVKIGC